MSLRARVTLAAAATAAVVLVIAGILIISLTDRDQRSALNASLAQQARNVAHPLEHLAASPAAALIQREAPAGVDGDRTVRLVTRTGTPRLTLGQPLPAQLGSLPAGVSTLTIGGQPYAVDVLGIAALGPIRTPLGGGASQGHARAVLGDQIQVFAPLAPLDSQRAQVRNRVLVVGLGAVAAVVLLAWFATGAALASLQRLRRRVDAVTATGDLDQRMPADGPPEVADVGGAFNAMLSRLQRSSAEREQALETARSFAADAAHELRTPLTSLGTNLQLLEDSGADPALVASLADDHARLAQTLEALHALTVGDLTPTSGEPVDLADLVALLTHEPQRHPGLHINVDTPDTAVTVRGDRESLRMLLDNLLTNAERHARPAGTGAGPIAVHVSVRRDGASWLVELDDDGRGFPPPGPERDRLLQRFIRGPGAGPGSGLGLAIADQQARRHGGSLTLSDAPSPDGSGGGARVELRLPAD